jgi:hypothetical protein
VFQWQCYPSQGQCRLLPVNFFRTALWLPPKRKIVFQIPWNAAFINSGFACCIWIYRRENPKKVLGIIECRIEKYCFGPLAPTNINRLIPVLSAKSMQLFKYILLAKYKRNVLIPSISIAVTPEITVSPSFWSGFYYDIIQ